VEQSAALALRGYELLAALRQYLALYRSGPKAHSRVAMMSEGPPQVHVILCRASKAAGGRRCLRRTIGTVAVCRLVVLKWNGALAGRSGVVGRRSNLPSRARVGR